jgi:hypothetical protein
MRPQVTNAFMALEAGYSNAVQVTYTVDSKSQVLALLQGYLAPVCFHCCGRWTCMRDSSPCRAALCPLKRVAEPLSQGPAMQLRMQAAWDDAEQPPQGGRGMGIRAAGEARPVHTCAARARSCKGNGT